MKTHKDACLAPVKHSTTNRWFKIGGFVVPMEERDIYLIKLIDFSHFEIVGFYLCKHSQPRCLEISNKLPQFSLKQKTGTLSLHALFTPASN